MCHKSIELPVSNAKVKAWCEGKALIQNALPQLNADQRELLISGICGSCFDALFKEEEPEPEYSDIL